MGGGERLLGASPCKAKELYRDKKLLPHFAYENAATSFLLLLLLFKSLFIFLFLTTFFYTGDFRFLKSGTFKTDLFSRCTARPTIFLSLNRRPLNIGIILLTEKPQRGAA